MVNTLFTVLIVAAMIYLLPFKSWKPKAFIALGLLLVSRITPLWVWLAYATPADIGQALLVGFFVSLFIAPFGFFMSI